MQSQEKLNSHPTLSEFKYLKDVRRENGEKLYKRQQLTPEEQEERKKYYADRRRLWAHENKEYYNQLLLMSYYRNHEKRKEAQRNRMRQKVECPSCGKVLSKGSLYMHKKKCLHPPPQS